MTGGNRVAPSGDFDNGWVAHGGPDGWDGSTGMRRVIASGAAAAAALVAAAVPAAAHNEWEPSTAAPGSVVDLTLFVADEHPDAGTTTVELFFPAPITVAALPAVPGWTATLMDGQVGGPAGGVTWAGGPAPGDVELPIRLGPLPSEPGRLQFKTVQTYDNGEVDRWIDEWPEGAPEPPAPGPVLDLVPGGPGSVPATTAAPSTTAATTTTTAATTTTGSDQAAADDTDDGSGGNVVPWVVAAAVILAVAGGGFAYLRSRRSPST
jgi:periplasmic copper chaperone A